MLSAKEAAKRAQQKIIERLNREDRFKTKENRRNTDEYSIGYNSLHSRLWSVEELIENAVNFGKYDARFLDECGETNEALAKLEGFEEALRIHLMSNGYGVQSEITNRGGAYRLVMKINWV